MSLTKSLKKWCVDNLEVKSDATDEDFRSAIQKGIANGKLSVEKFSELQTTKDTEPGDRVKTLVADSVAEAVGTAMGPITESIKTLGESVAALATKKPEEEETEEEEVDDGTNVDDEEKNFQTSVDKEVKRQLAGLQEPASPQGMSYEVFARRMPNVLGCKDKYAGTKARVVAGSHTKGGKPHVSAGQDLYNPSTKRALYYPSELEQACNGAWLKRMIGMVAGKGDADIARMMRLTEHDKDLIMYAIKEFTFSGEINKRFVLNRKLTELEQKALLDDSTSGGEEAVPDVFDDAVITTPLLHGELFPMVNVVNLSQGSSVDGWSISNPTITSNQAEGTAINLESTASMIAAFDTTIFTNAGAIEIGLDFEDDSPTNIGQLLVTLFGESLMEWLDNQIANGDGSTEPLGILLTSGTTVISTTNGTSGPWVTGDFEQMLFGLNKAMRNAKGGRTGFVMNDTTYRRARAINIGTNDERRIFGMDHENYTLLDRPVKIQDNIADNDAAFVNFGFYRLYRRLGQQIILATGGQTLALKNTKMVILRARYGGQMELGSAVAEVNTAPVVNS